MKKNYLFAMLLVISSISFAQTTISGMVISDTGKPLPLAEISIDGSGESTTTDFDGVFTLKTSKSLPVTIQASADGFVSSSTYVSSNTENIIVKLSARRSAVNELEIIVQSASRAPERLFDSPVSIEQYTKKDIKNTPAIDFYGGLENVKGVDLNTGSLTSKLINTRGFASFESGRFLQLVDGMDNAYPALGLPIGLLGTVNELDINSIELLPGASSALYGAGAFNGSLFINTKNPFDYQGISAYYKTGITSQEAAGENQFYDAGVRIAHAFSDKFAGKVSFSYLKGTDWLATNTTNKLNPTTDRTDPSYDGVNVYGDEIAAPLPGIGLVSRTGYEEKFLNDNTVENLKFDAALHYKPFADDFEIIYNGKIGRGTTILQATNRFRPQNLFTQQHKLEIRNDNFFLRGYISTGKAKDSYDIGFTGININRSWKGDQAWFGDYATSYFSAISGGQSMNEAHAFARQSADTGRLIPGTPAFQNALNTVTKDPDFATGSKFLDKSQLKHADANYNFSHITGDFIDIQVGGSFREYKLDTEGTYFTDLNSPIIYSQYGLYSQLQKKLFNDRLKITASMRYDKTIELFEGNFSPRIAFGYTAGARRNHNFRTSYQTGFRNPTNQNLYAGINIGGAILAGTAIDNLGFSREFTLEDGRNITLSVKEAFDNSYTSNSIQSYLQTGDSSVLEQSRVSPVQPEELTTYEFGYRGKINKVNIDLNVYYNDYTNFIVDETVVVPFNGQVSDGTALPSIAAGDFAQGILSTNAAVDVTSYGATIAMDTKILGGFDLGVSYSYAEQDFDSNDDPDFESGFNTPTHRTKAMFGHNKLFKNFGFNSALRWSESYIWESAFATGEIPSYTVIDAQMNYTIPVLKTTFKAGATNIGGKEYSTAYGAGLIGSQYYIGLSINNL